MNKLSMLTTLSKTFQVFLIIILIIYSLISYCAFQMNQAEQSQLESLNVQKELENLGRSLAKGSDYLTREIRLYVQFGNHRHLKNFWEEVNETKTREVIDDLIKLKVFPKEAEYIRKSKARSDNLIKTEEEAMQAVKNGAFDKARKLVFGKYYLKQKDLIMGDIVSFQKAVEMRTRQAVDKAQTDTRFYMLATNILIFIAGALVLFILINFVTKRLIVPIRRLSGVMKEVSSGDLGACAPLSNHKDEIYDLSLVFNKMILDIKDAKRKEIIFAKAKEKAEASNQAKSEFLARMSHEFRTPMNAIMGFTQLLEMDPQNKLSDIEKKNLGMISSAGNHLLELINEVLDLSRVESGDMKLSIDTVDIVPIVDNVISLSKPLAKEKGISIKYQEIPEDCWFVEVDPLRFKQVVLNLISNAIKYNKPNGSVVVSYEKQDNGMRRLGVRDTGHGIAEDNKGKLFIPFERFDTDAEHIDGTGIGLTITKKIIESMNGTIGFESTAGEGSFFYIDIPVSDKAPLPIQVDEKADLIQPSLTSYKKTVLYVEDILANVELVRQILKCMQGIRLLAASTALEGIELAQAETPDLILMDIHMPGMDGLAAFKKLQTMNETKDIPVIALTADAMDENIKKALSIGFKDCITKPIDVPKFLKVIDKVFI